MNVFGAIVDKDDKEIERVIIIEFNENHVDFSGRYFEMGELQLVNKFNYVGDLKYNNFMISVDEVFDTISEARENVTREIFK